MRKIYISLALCTALLFSFASMAQPAVCTDTTEIYLNTEGKVEINADHFELDTSLYDSLTLAPNSFSCAHVGSQTLEVDLFKEGVFQDSCTAVFEVRDTISPLLIIGQVFRKYIEADDTLDLTLSNLPLQEYDNCGIDTIVISPSQIDSSHVEDSLITITATDINGNQTSVHIRLRLRIIDCEEEVHNCVFRFRPNLRYEDVKVTAADLVHEQTRDCDYNYLISWIDLHGNPIDIPNNTLTEDHLNDTLIAIVRNIETSETCSTEVMPENCIYFHELNIKWPEDFSLNLSCPNDSLPDLQFLSPENLDRHFNIDPAYYSINIDTFCNRENIYYSYKDTILDSDTLQTVLRTWTLFNWNTGKILKHTQLIRVYPGQEFSASLKCHDEITFLIHNEPYRVIETQYVLEDDGIYICDSIQMSFLDMDFNPLQLPDNRVYKSFEDPYFYAVTATLNSMEQCTTKVNLELGPIYCWERFNVCDQLPRGQSFDNCDSTYTTEDNIEWPRDVRLSICDTAIEAATPEYLISQAGIELADAYPEVFLDDCERIHLELGYRDEFPDSASMDFPKRIHRTWTVAVGDDFTPFPINYWSYTQEITIDGVNSCNDLFKVRTGKGLPISNVEIGAGFSTGQNGEIDLQGYPNDSIIPEFTGNAELTDITLKDLRLLNQALDKAIYLNSVQRIAADVNLDGQITEADVTALNDYIYNDIPLERNWVFVSLDSPLAQMDDFFSVSAFEEKLAYEENRDAYEYVGIRIGDIDLSILQPREIPGDTLTLHYEDQFVEEGQMVNVPISIVEDLPAALSIQFAFEFDHQKLQFSEIVGVGADDVNSSNYNHITNSIVRFLWFEEFFIEVKNGKLDPIGLKPFIEARFIALEDGYLCDLIQVDTTSFATEVVYVDHQYQHVEAMLASQCDGEITNMKQPLADELLTIYPNPASETLHIDYGSELQGEIRYNIRNLYGGIISSGSISMNEAITLENIPSGVYLLEVQEKENSAVIKRFVVQK